MFGNGFHAPPLSFSPSPLNNVHFFARTNFWNNEKVIFNIDMGEGERTVCLSKRNIENYAFSKNFCTRLKIHSTQARSDGIIIRSILFSTPRFSEESKLFSIIFFKSRIFTARLIYIDAGVTVLEL